MFIPFDGQSAIILSKGHRVIQGLYADGQTIISTEHGPRGGDEINKIVEGGNYGWPIATEKDTTLTMTITKLHIKKS